VGGSHAPFPPDLCISPLPHTLQIERHREITLTLDSRSRGLGPTPAVELSGSGAPKLFLASALTRSPWLTHLPRQWLDLWVPLLQEVSICWQEAGSQLQVSCQVPQAWLLPTYLVPYLPFPGRWETSQPQLMDDAV
jgi:hypothetical protein